MQMTTGKQAKRLARRRGKELPPIEEEVVTRSRHERLPDEDRRTATMGLVAGALVFTGAVIAYAALTIPALLG